MLSKQCKLHLESVNMTGWQHMKHALSIAFRLQVVVLAVIVHSIGPRFFKTYASDTMRRILDEQTNISK
ncbi:DUF6356 family protein [bacterium]|jgi:hypothetical protein|nr:DUF6356 family protein [bacterium]